MYICTNTLREEKTMSKRSTWCDFDKDTRKYIKKRDNERCVVCGRGGALQIMHIFLSRAHGGKGDKRNGCLGCVKCHNEMDNGNNTERSMELKKRCEEYLIEKEHIQDVKKLVEELTFKKEKITVNFNDIILKNAEKMQKEQKYCKKCMFLIKRLGKNTTIPSYYCKYRKIFINKSTKACKKYTEEI